MVQPVGLWLQQQRARFCLRRGLAYLRKDNFPKAIALLSEAIAAHPTPALVYRHRARVHWQRGHLSAAQTDLDQAIALDPQDALAYGGRGLLRYQQGDRDGALADWDQALQGNTHNATVYYNRGLLYAQEQQWTAALADLDAAIALQPLLAEAYLHRGKVHQALGDLDSAIRDWKLALCNDLRLDEARQCLQSLRQESVNQDLCETLQSAIPPEAVLNLTVRHDTLTLELHRPVGTPINYFTLPDRLRDCLVALQLPRLRRFHLMARAGEATLAEWNQTYQIYDRVPCPPTHWRAALASTLLLCPPFGVVALIYAAQVRQAYRRGDYPLAAKASQTVRGLCLGSGAIAGLLLFILMGYGIYTQVDMNTPNAPAKAALLPPQRHPTPPQ